MAEESEIAWLVTRAEELDRIPLPSIGVYDPDQDCTRRHAKAPSVDLDGNDIAYVIYTSGSTGRPKGVMVAHRGLSNTAQEMGRAFGVEKGSRVLQIASLSFDASIFEIAEALTAGGSLCLVDREEMPPGPELGAWLARQRISHVTFSPSILAVIPPLPPPNPRVIVVAGERCPENLVRRWRPGRALFNLYGATEASIYSTMERCEIEQGAPAVGRPVGNTRAYVLDAGMAPVPVGATGEIFLGGEGVTRGYWKRPRLTASKFVPDPYAGKRGARLYRTGDLGRQRGDGRLEFSERIDHQIKIRGFRIELGEIESVLANHEQVAECVVVARSRPNREKELVAYVVAEKDQSPVTADLRERLRLRLPAFMIPSTFAYLKKVPLTVNGKVDRKALPEPTPLQEERPAPLAARDPVEAELLSIWREILGIESIGVTDNFFDLGGHSLLATAAVSRIREKFKIDFPLRDLFKLPTVAETAEILRQTLKTKSLAKDIPLQSRPRAEASPLSYAQQRLWFLDQLHSEGVFYNILQNFHLLGALHVPALELAFLALIDRHESLRTVFEPRDGTPVQILRPAPNWMVTLIDLSGIDGPEKELGRWLEKESSTPFDLEKGPLLRLALFRVSLREHQLIMDQHHIITDGWSMSIMVDELAFFYETQLTNKPNRLTRRPIQYADYAIWQKKWLAGGEWEQQLTYWRDRLAGASTLLNLPTDRTRPAIQRFRGAHEHFALSTALTEAVGNLARKRGVTSFMVLLAGFQVLMARYSGQSDILVGAPVAGRNHPLLERVVGFFVNTLVLRARLEKRPAFVEFLDRVRETALDAYAHQDAPFERVVEAVGAVRSLDRTPLVQVVFAYQNEPPNQLRLRGLATRALMIENRAAKFDMVVSLTRRDDQIEGLVEYDTDLFNGQTITRMMIHYQNLLARIVIDPYQRVDAIEFLSPEERKRQLIDWNKTETDFDLKQFFPDLFTNWANRAPDHPAVSLKNRSVTYSWLNRRANRLAGFLAERGVGRGHLVGICLEPSIEMIVAVLGVLKSGAGYLPLDPAYPRDRLGFMLEESEIAWLVTRASSRDRLPPISVGVYDPELDDSDHAPYRPWTALDGDDLAYLIYTSGSTGRPKGVMVTHRGLSNTVLEMNRVFDVTPDSRVLQMASLSFDASIFEITEALAAGGTLCLVDREEMLPGPELGDWLARTHITHVTFSPSVLAVIPRTSSRYPRVIVVAGETCPADLVRKWRPDRAFFNLYGATEASIYSTMERCVVEAEAPAVGRPVGNARAYVLETGLAPVAVGIVGEIYLGGKGVTRGYWRRPALTASKFVPDPHGGESGARLYRTGDLGKQRETGKLEFVARIDHQVKIRGFRIELGEIESALANHDLVADCVVVARASARGKVLVAYLVAKEKSVLSTLREYLSKNLPSYMLPGAYVLLERIPLTDNGKVDRKALPEPETGSGDEIAELVAPRNRTEEKLVAIWEELLAVRPVGVTQGFFDLGGNSLIAASLKFRIERAFSTMVPLRKLFELQSIEEITYYLDSDRARPEPLAIPHRDSRHEAELSFAQQRLWFLDRLEPRSSFYNTPYALILKGRLDIRALSLSLKDLIERHEILRTHFETRNDTPVQVVEKRTTWRSRLVDVSALRDQAPIAHKLADAEAVRPFDLNAGPMIRTLMIRLSDREHWFVLTMHHIVSDGWSIMILVRELASSYRSLLRKKEPKPVPPADPIRGLRGLAETVFGGRRMGWSARLLARPIDGSERGPVLTA